MDTLHEKKQRLEDYLRSLGSAAVAFSSGVDSTFLLKTAHNVLGNKVIAVTAASCFFQERELEEASAFCKKEGIEQVIFDPAPLSIEGLSQNPKNRCYICKKAVFTKIGLIAAEHGLAYVAEGSNMDDNDDYRPGHMAVAELGIKSPLREAELTKEEIRQLSKEMGLPTWDKPSYACLATRFVYGETITEEKLYMVDKAEQRLHDMGFRQVRVRVHGQMARIETDPAQLESFMKPEVYKPLTEYLHELGFLYVALDLDGYSTGSMNKQGEALHDYLPPPLVRRK
ncbi:MAG: ATP-dependent sacrificial sulfur transferase LarE [Oscillospiraceae bacterium]|nr:ATP-dependent sacrificial sulfur transferase LarE [Oscillospiraceae bacterium]